MKSEIFVIFCPCPVIREKNRQNLKYGSEKPVR